MEVDLTKPAGLALALLDSVLEMSDRVEALGGATSIAGIAALNTLQTSLQKNKGRVRSALAAAQKAAS
jgi:hypothetical protein